MYPTVERTVPVITEKEQGLSFEAVLLCIQVHGRGDFCLGRVVVIVAPITNHQQVRAAREWERCSNARQGAERRQRAKGEALPQKTAAADYGSGNDSIHAKVLPLCFGSRRRSVEAMSFASGKRWIWLAVEATTFACSADVWRIISSA